MFSGGRFVPNWELSLYCVYSSFSQNIILKPPMYLNLGSTHDITGCLDSKQFCLENTLYRTEIHTGFYRCSSHSILWEWLLILFTSRLLLYQRPICLPQSWWVEVWRSRVVLSEAWTGWSVDGVSRTPLPSSGAQQENLEPRDVGRWCSSGANRDLETIML